jgi:hypothetical protein
MVKAQAYLLGLVTEENSNATFEEFRGGKNIFRFTSDQRFGFEELVLFFWMSKCVTLTNCTGE